jgi:hypothetical protein
VDRRVGRDPAPIGVERIGAFVGRQAADEIGKEFGPEPPRRFDERPVKFGSGPEEDGAKDETADALPMPLGISQRQRRPPRAADHQPTGDAELTPDAFDIGDQMVGGVRLQAIGRLTPPGPALIEQDRAEARGVEQFALPRAAAAARAAMQEQRRDAVGAPDFLDIDFMTVADVEPADMKRGAVGGRC